MEQKFDGVLPLLAALLVLASSVWRAETTLSVSIGALILLSLYFFLKKKN